MKQKSLQHRLRLLVQAISFAFHNGYVTGWMHGKIYTGGNKEFCVPGLNCYSCPGAVGSCPIGSLQAVLDSGTYHYSLYVLGWIGLMGMAFGRLICGWLCPFGFIQDLVHKIPFLPKRKNLPGHRYLRFLRYLILIVFVIILPMAVQNVAGMGQPWFCAYICPSGTLLGGIPLVLANPSLQSGIGFRFFWKLALLVLFLLGAGIFDRPFCKYVCPLGALYGLCNPVSVYRLKVKKETCIECGACQKACGMDIQVWKDPNSIDCIRCLKCRTACPTGSIVSNFEALGLKLRRAEERPADAAAGSISAASVAAPLTGDVDPQAAPAASAAAAEKTAESMAKQVAVEPCAAGSAETAGIPAPERSSEQGALQTDAAVDAANSGLEKTTMPGRIFRILIGVVCIVAAIAELGMALFLHLFYAYSRMIDGLGYYLATTWVSAVGMGIAILVLILGVRLIAASGTHARDRELRQWAGISILADLLLCFVGNGVMAIVLTRLFTTGDSTLPECIAEFIQDGLPYCAAMLVPAAAALLALLPKRK